ncbi:hypothetical protein CCACVL1_01543 [Corchorus capsularis]|uniref:Uncharacterized protein n=1 Tax=Corchorus capsularis TaxID=210143 RepID=A0A1R3KHI8_COCAP|nr:hypothetical protein CCACVL1_01543 [Corchorus capsularis]
MVDAKEGTSSSLSEGLAPHDSDEDLKSPPGSPKSSTRKACYAALQSWVSKKFMTGCVVLFPVTVTFLLTWWFIQFVDGFFSPIYAKLGFDIFASLHSASPSVVHWHAADVHSGHDCTYGGSCLCASGDWCAWYRFSYLYFLLNGLHVFGVGLGFITSLLFIFFVGIFASSWLGASFFWLGEWFIKRMPFVKHIYSASKQISAAISPDQNTTAFKEVAIIRHPRLGEYAFGFITSSVILQRDDGDEELCSVYVPTNCLYIGDIFLVNSEEIIRPNLSIREGIEPVYPSISEHHIMFLLCRFRLLDDSFE